MRTKPSLLALLAGLMIGLPAPGQDRSSAAESAESPAPSAWERRLRKDLAKGLQEVLRGPLAFRGSLESHCEPNRANALVPQDATFIGAIDGDTRWYSIAGWQVVATDFGEAVKSPERDWDEPLGDAPDLPAIPRLLLPHLAHGELSKPVPSEFHGRPAMSAHVRWRRKAVRQVMMTLTVPDLKAEAILEAVANAAARGNDNVYLDGRVLYDPATSRWLATTVRFAYLNGDPLEPDDERLTEPPPGLPKLNRTTLLSTVWTIERIGSDEAPMPDLPERHRRRLHLPK